MKLVKVGKYWVNPEKVNFVYKVLAGSGVVVNLGVGSGDKSIVIDDLTTEEVVEILNNA